MKHFPYNIISVISKRLLALGHYHITTQDALCGEYKDIKLCMNTPFR